MKQKPARLYKYFTTDRLTILQNGLIRFTPPGDFNDPFEFRAPLVRVMTRKEMYDAMRTQARKDVRQQLHAAFPSKSVRETQVNMLADQILSANSQELDQKLALGQKAFCDYMNNEAFPFAANKVLGVLCLTQTPTSSLMWGHYTNSYTGFAVEFDANHPFFSCPSSIHEDVGKLHEVQYRKQRPELDLENQNLDFLFSKSQEWAYEQEWRLIRPLASADKVISGKPFEIHLFQIPTEAISAVIVGHRMTHAHFDELRAHLQTHKHIELKRIELHETQYALRVQPLNTWEELNADKTRAMRGKQFIDEIRNA